MYFRAPWRKFLPHLRDGDAVQVKNAEVDGIFLGADGDLGMFITTYLPSKGESAAQFTPQRCRELLLTAVGEKIDVQIIDVAPWQPYEQVADRFQSGRAFLVGDSAHTMPPLKAGGANAAIQSAHNLAWKLAAVLDGVAGPALLATYHAERHPVGRFSAQQSLTGPTLALLRFEDNEPGLPAQEEQPMFALLVGYQYRSTAVADEPAPADPDTARPDVQFAYRMGQEVVLPAGMARTAVVRRRQDHVVTIGEIHEGSLAVGRCVHRSTSTRPPAPRQPRGSHARR